MENQKNLFLAIIISMAIIFGFQLLVPQPERALVTEENNAQESVSLDIQGTTSTILLDRDQVLEETVRVTFDNSKIKGSINLEGGFIDDLVLEEYRKTLDPTSDFIGFLNPLGSEDASSEPRGFKKPIKSEVGSSVFLYSSKTRSSIKPPSKLIEPFILELSKVTLTVSSSTWSRSSKIVEVVPWISRLTDSCALFSSVTRALSGWGTKSWNPNIIAIEIMIARNKFFWFSILFFNRVVSGRT